MRLFAWLFILLLASSALKAQQVTKTDCCIEVGNKATIIINENTNAKSSEPAAAKVVVSNGFDFKLDVSSNTSAGVYNTDGVLVRTLWSGVRYDAGCYTGQWDGLLDDETEASFGNYTVKVLSNNVKYTWERVIGDTSTDPFSDYRLRGNDITTLCVVGQKLFYSWGYSEHSAAQNMLLLSDINKKASEPNSRTTQNSVQVCTDGNIIYWGGDKSTDDDFQSWVVGAYPDDNADPYKFIHFSAGKSVTANSGSGNLTDNYAISIVRSGSNGNTSNYITGMAVQKNGNYLFVTRSGLDQLQVLDKVSGSLVKTLTYQHPSSIAVDNSNNLFIINNNLVKKFRINADGTLTNMAFELSGLTLPVKISATNDGTKLAVADNGTYQIKIYSTLTGTLLNTLGREGGYTLNPYAQHDKFSQFDFLYYQDDSSLWVGQSVDHKILHFNADLSFKEESMHLPTSRAVAVDQNNPTRIFCNLTEFERDYSKTLDNGANGSWKLKANWNKGKPLSDNYAGFKNVITLSNGRTYGQLKDQNNDYYIAELTQTGLRNTGIYTSDVSNIGRDGTMFTHGDNGSFGNQPTGIYRRLLSGFDNSNNPIWGTATLFVTDPPTSSYTPWFGYENTSGHTASANQYVYFNNGTGTSIPLSDTQIGYRLGAVKANTATPIWKTSRTTSRIYQGDYPRNGDFDIGNDGLFPQHSETHAMIYDNDVFWNVNGEFWKSGEINIWNHFNKNGLFIGNFGKTGEEAALLPGSPEMAGNAFSTGIVKVGENYYIYHCDESVHAGVHSWKITGLNTITEQSIPITLVSNLQKTQIAQDNSDLMRGLPTMSRNFEGDNNWTVEGTTAQTNYLSYLKDFSDIDIRVAGDGIHTLKRKLASNPLKSWNLTGKMSMQDSEPSIYEEGAYNYLELLDINNKVMARFRIKCNAGAGYYTYIEINNKIIDENQSVNLLYNSTIRRSFQDFQFNYDGTLLTFKYASYNSVNITTPFDKSADISAPGYLRVRLVGGQFHAMSLYKLKFNNK